MSSQVSVTAAFKSCVAKEKWLHVHSGQRHSGLQELWQKGSAISTNTQYKLNPQNLRHRNDRQGVTNWIVLSKIVLRSHVGSSYSRESRAFRCPKSCTPAWRPPNKLHDKLGESSCRTHEASCTTTWTLCKPRPRQGGAPSMATETAVTQGQWSCTRQIGTEETRTGAIG